MNDSMLHDLVQPEKYVQTGVQMRCASAYKGIKNKNRR